ncbi:hypothetical protein [Priestia endophytica]|uniref:hypothetical protein n=1 Tax=Priestia endophytica TaxID=135735 RepID=UPI000DCA63C2|nr:hypothetical protein [Priestia endophytica]RAS81166.1 hypothetical protein A4R27_11440 [Priestia endophytica]
MNLKKEEDVQSEIEELRGKVKELENVTQILYEEIQNLQTSVPANTPRASSPLVGQIGGLVLGAIALIGLFWF